MVQNNKGMGEKIEELRNLKYKGAIKSSIKAWCSIEDLKASPIAVQVLTDSIYEHTMEILNARIKQNNSKALTTNTGGQE